MAGNTSATGGYLDPASTPAPLEDDALEDVFQAAIVGVTGMAGANVRPRWQTTSPKQPDASTDWCAFSVNVTDADAGPYIEHDGSANGGLGFDHYQRHEDIELFATFYGPNSGKLAALLRDGLAIPQNMEGLRGNGIAFVDDGPIRHVPELHNKTWFQRRDISLRFRRQVKRDYAIENIASAGVTLISDEIGTI